MTAPSLIARQLRTAGKAFRSWLRSRANARLRHPNKQLTQVATVCLASFAVLGSTGCLLGAAPTLAQEKPRVSYVTKAVDDNVLNEALEALRRGGSVTPKSLTARTGETLSSLLARLEIQDPNAFAATRAIRDRRHFA